MNLPFPSPPDPADVPADIENLASAVNTWQANHVAMPLLRIGGMPGGTTALTVNFVNAWAGGVATFAMPPLAANAVVAFQNGGTGLVTLTGTFNLFGAAPASGTLTVPQGQYVAFVADQGGSAWWMASPAPKLAAKIARGSVPYAIPAGETPVWFNLGVFDNGGMSDVANSRIVAPRPGLYLATAQVQMNGGNGENVYCWISVNGGITQFGNRIVMPPSGQEAGLTCSAYFQLARGDVIQAGTGIAATGATTLVVSASGLLTNLMVTAL